MTDPTAEQVAVSESITAAVEEAVETVAAAKEPKPNVVVVRAVNGIVAITLTALLGAIALIFKGQNPPDGVIAVASGGMGALSTLLTVRGVDR